MTPVPGSNIGIVAFPQGGVIFIPHAIVESQIGAQFPLILDIPDIVLLPGLPDTGKSVVEGAGSTQISQELDLLSRILQEGIQVGEGVGGASLAVRVNEQWTDLPSEFHGVTPFNPVQVIDKRE